MELRDYQKEIVRLGINVLKEHKFVYLAMEVRTGKTLTSLSICKTLAVSNVLFITNLTIRWLAIVMILLLLITSRFIK